MKKMELQPSHVQERLGVIAGLYVKVLKNFPEKSRGVFSKLTHEILIYYHHCQFAIPQNRIGR